MVVKETRKCPGLVIYFKNTLHLQQLNWGVGRVGKIKTATSMHDLERMRTDYTKFLRNLLG